MQLDIGKRIDGKFNIWRRWTPFHPWIIINVVKFEENAKIIVERLMTWHTKRITRS